LTFREKPGTTLPIRPTIHEVNTMAEKTERAQFVDRMRGLAMLVMIEVHVTNSLMLPALRETAWFPLLNFINGLVAPSFLFISGFAFGLAAEKKLAEFRRFGSAFWLQLGRIGLIALLGFLLHLPYFSLRLTLKNWRWIHWNYFFSFDILHCIAAGLLFLFAARLLIRSDRGYGRFLIGGAAIALLAAPFAWQVDWWRIAPAPLAGALSPARPALFPLLPWLAFLFFGGIVSERFRLAKSAGADAERRHFRRLALLAAALIVLGRVFLLSALNFQQYIAPIRPNWVFFGYRLGWVLALLCLCRWLDDVKRGRLPWVVAAGRESLLVYVAHLMILYRHVFGLPNVVEWVGRRLDLGQALLGSLALAAAMVVLAIGWGRIKRRDRRLARRITALAFAAFLVLFVLARSA